jgi:lipopolysaccharide/colanic/teichoic acid biosynthesis glycosyltransferase
MKSNESLAAIGPAVVWPQVYSATETPVTVRRTAPRARPSRRLYHVTKRLFDILAVLAATPLLLPVLLISAALIKLESPGGPVLFAQQRTGMAGRRFKLFKFRTMVPNAEELKQRYRDQNLLTWPDFKMANDPRITRIGRFMRKTSLDELPQLFNVLKGDMSLVGPRPTSFDSSTYQLWHTERLDVRPGITGLWQIKGRGRIDFDDRVRLDIAYIKNRSLWLDLKLICLTVPVLLAGE